MVQLGPYVLYSGVKMLISTVFFIVIFYSLWVVLDLRVVLPGRLFISIFIGVWIRNC